LPQLLTRQVTIPTSVTGLAAVAAQTRPTAAISNSSFLAGKTSGEFGAGVGVH